MGNLEIYNLTKVYDNKTVLDNISFTVNDGEFLSILGPSGCGKTTLLKILIGIETPTDGKILKKGVDITKLDPSKREMGMVFQNYALFPNMTVLKNVMYALSIKYKNKEKAKKEAIKILNLVNMEEHLEKYPHELSGGQQQRVAIARGIVMNPKVLLLDESLCSLDLKLKKTMQVELKKIQKKLGITFIYVTHAQDEALSLSDRIVVINKGKIEQIDTPENIYRRPNSIFVADFIGEANIIDANVIESKNNVTRLSIFDNNEVEINTLEKYDKNEKIKLVIRPENILVLKKKKSSMLEGLITNITYSGDNTLLTINISNDYVINARVSDISLYQEDDIVYIDFDWNFVVPLRK